MKKIIIKILKNPYFNSVGIILILVLNYMSLDVGINTSNPLDITIQQFVDIKGSWLSVLMFYFIVALKVNYDIECGKIEENKVVGLKY